MNREEQLITVIIVVFIISTWLYFEALRMVRKCEKTNQSTRSQLEKTNKQVEQMEKLDKEINQHLNTMRLIRSQISNPSKFGFPQPTTAHNSEPLNPNFPHLQA